MKRASKYFVEFEQTRIEQAVKDAEANTAAEIVPVLATTSGRYDRAEDVVGLWTGAICLCLAWLGLQTQGTDIDADWGTTWSQFELPLIVLSLVLGFLIGAFAASHIPWLRRIFTPKKQMTDEVTAAASRVFFDHRVHHTEGSTGLLIYVSLFEHQAIVLGDQTIQDTLGHDALDALCQELIKGIVAGDTATAFCDVIEDAGKQLAEVLPRSEDDTNEHPDALILID